MRPFSTPLKGVEKGCIGNKWVKEINNIYFLIHSSKEFFLWLENLKNTSAVVSQ